ncbi:hypothetical protein KY385_01540 [Candidatus Parcubacteria bacterium]|nr:hypothetical protein [Candidatus Parcubacteria bacterium]
MPDDQQISQSVDNLISQTPDEESAPSAPSGQQPTSAYSLGSDPLSSPPADNIQDQNAATSDPASPPLTMPVDDDAAKADQPISSDELSQIKEQALSQLTPIIGDLDQPPEEKYRTLMMLIQASDDKSLIKQAFEAANGIEDKKAKAEALLNIVNEINYFSSKTSET